MRGVLAITGAAAAVLAGLWLLPARPRLTHMDFVAGGPDALEFCDAANPRFLPVVARSSPVIVSLSGTEPYFAGSAADLVLTLRTNTGKPIGPGDLLGTGGRKLNLFAIDPSLTDFQAIEPQPGGAGEWQVRFTPRAGGAYRFFADFTPAATSQEMYASADLPVQGAPAAKGEARSAEVGGRSLRLSSAPAPVRLREPAVLTLLASADGPPPAGGELIAFDQTRSGMVDLRLDSKGSGRVSFPDSGPYAVWARVGAGGQERLVPFSLVVQP